MSSSHAMKEFRLLILLFMTSGIQGQLFGQPQQQGSDVCDVGNDLCPSKYKLNGRCDDFRLVCSNNNDCFDCDPCMRLRMEGCESCTATAGCRWCGSDNLCVSAELLDNIELSRELSDTPFLLSPPKFTCQLHDFVSTCPRKDGPFSAPLLYESMDWVYEMINVKPVWEAGLTGTGVGVRINDVGVAVYEDKFIRNFDRSSSCERFLPASLSSTHGTICAGLLASSPENQCSVGIAPDVTLSACDVSGFEGESEFALIQGFNYLFANQERMDISSNSMVPSICLKQRNRRRRLIRDWLEASSPSSTTSNAASCPFVGEGSSWSPCTPESPCAGTDDWSGPLTAACERHIVQYCGDPLRYEKDEAACSLYLSLSWRCTYGISSDDIESVLMKGIMEGRQGKGMIYLFGSGNGHTNGEDTNFLATLNTRFTISVGAVGRDGLHSSFSTTGSALSVTAPGGDHDHISNMVTSVMSGVCVETSAGTSWATPIVAGVLALVLQANPNLTWRDVQGILATTSSFQKQMDDCRHRDSWTMNAAGVYHSYKYGFGVIDANAAMTAAKSWKLYGPELELRQESGSINLNIPDYQEGDVSSTITVEGTGTISSYKTESVMVYVDLSHSSRGDLEVILTSPSGTESILHPGPRPENRQEDDGWKLLTLRHWNENPIGEWTLRLMDQREGDLEECRSDPEYFFIANGRWDGLPNVFRCPSFAKHFLCTPEGKDGLGLRTFPFDLSTGTDNDVSSSPGLTSPIFSAQSGIGPLEACCECGGGVLTVFTPEILKSWTLIVYAHEVDDEVGGGFIPSPTTGVNPTGAPTTKNNDHNDSNIPCDNDEGSSHRPTKPSPAPLPVELDTSSTTAMWKCCWLKKFLLWLTWLLL